MWINVYISEMNNIISIIIPIYNQEKFLSTCLDSILASNNTDLFEIILIDDGSTDKGLQICNLYAKKFNNVRVFHQPNKGVSVARNLGIKKAKGSWIWFIDSDDIPVKGAVDLLYKRLDTNTDVVIFTCRDFEDKDKILTHIELKETNIRKISKKNAIGTLFDMDYASFPWNKIFKKSLLVENKIIFPEDMIMCEDIEFCYKAYANAEYFSLYPEALYNYRRDGNSASLKENRKKYKDAAIANFDLYNFIQANYKEYTNRIFKNAVATTVAYLHHYESDDEKFKKFDKFIKENKSKYRYLSLRFRLEIFSYLYLKPVFYVIGIAETSFRYFKNSKIKTIGKHHDSNR